MQSTEKGAIFILSMITQQTQIKINLSATMKDYLESKASKFGMPIAGYVKTLILNDIKDMDYPTYQASDSTEKAYKKALQEYDEGKTIKVDDVDTFFEEL